jgi:hypothetical protein
VARLCAWKVWRPVFLIANKGILIRPAILGTPEYRMTNFHTALALYFPRLAIRLYSRYTPRVFLPPTPRAERMSSQRNCTGIPANSDVAGIGIRVSIYITTLIISIIPDIDDRTKKLRGDLVTAAGLNGFSLLARVCYRSFYPLRYLLAVIDHSAYRNCK